jgi:hypothetical protein
MLIARDLARSLDPCLLARDCGIEPDPWQAALLRAKPRRGLLCCARQTGKSTTCGILGLDVAVHEPGSLTVILAPAQRQSAEMLRSIRLMHGNLDGVPALASESVLKLELENDSRILALPGGEADGKTIRGLAGARLVIVDEAARVPDDLLAAIRPMLATNAAGALVLLSTPAGKRGAFYELWHNGDPTWHRVRVPVNECPRISKQFLAEELRDLGPARYSEEYELAFIDSDTAAFPTRLIDQAFDPNLKAIFI